MMNSAEPPSRTDPDHVLTRRQRKIVQFISDEVRRTSSICSDSARRSVDLRQVEVPQALAAPAHRRLASIAERD
jgi:hypothetical protein